jgi:tRNA-dihydrouridine synthase B
LLKDEQLVANLLQAVVGAVKVPVTLKIRTGWDPLQRNGARIAKIAEDSGIQALAVHGRTRACMFEGEAEYETIRAIKQAVQIPIFANGDIDSPQKAKQVLQQTGADGLMIGRAAQGRPWLFREIEKYLNTGIVPAAPSHAEVRDMMRAHLRDLYAFYGEEMGVRVARKHIGWYAAGRPHGEAFRRIVMQATTAASQLSAVENYFESLDGDANAANDCWRAHGAKEKNENSQRVVAAEKRTDQTRIHQGQRSLGAAAHADG